MRVITGTVRINVAGMKVNSGAVRINAA
ncbi:hypothetical protein JOC48_003998 [Aquibacillus albus]|uniref:Uncharacterized protein n=1 Tax=Aquibacillus albus TaxID=1168171 RepID=A0ABS2N5N0_9BACI|nr:hypothetical protein [Aquibacillus albus]